MLKKILLLAIFIPVLNYAQHTLKGQLPKEEPFKWVMMYKVRFGEMDFVAYKMNDSLGRVAFDMDSTISPGVYKLIYAMPQSKHNFDVLYNGKEDIEFEMDITRSVTFKTSEENKLYTSYQHSMDNINKALDNVFSEKTVNKKAFMDIMQTLKTAQKQYEEAASGKMVECFIQSNAPYIPSGFEDRATYQANVRSHLFDHVDFSNELLQSSDFLIERIMDYIMGCTDGQSGSKPYKKALSEVLVRLEKSSDTFQMSMLNIIWNQFTTMGIHDMGALVGEQYLLPKVKTMENVQIIEQVSNYLNTSIGKKAPDFDFGIDTNDESIARSLYEMDGSDYYLLMFWSATCGHCLNALPKVKAYASTLPEGFLKVIAVGLENEPNHWEKQIPNYPGFVHVFGSGKWDNPIRKLYAVEATPTYFLLDQDKRIIAKPSSFEETEQLLNAQKAQN